MGERNPLAQVKGWLGFNSTALICSKYSATFKPVIDSIDMVQKYKVYCGSSTLWITNEIPDHFSGRVVEMKDVQFDIKKEWRDIQDQNLLVIWLDDNVPAAWAHFQSCFRLIQAAGGRVINEDNAVLFIYRRDTWDLAKGKVDKGETLEEAAVREVKEECGLVDLHLQSFLLATYHIYEIKHKWVLKTTFWYNMSATKHQPLIPQLEEEITDMRWFAPSDQEWRSNTFPSIADVMDA